MIFQHQNVKIKNDTKLIEKYINSILIDIEKVRVNKSLTIVKDNLELLDKCSDGKYWFEIDFNITNEITNKLAPLMKYKSKIEPQVAHFDLEDSISSITEVKINHPSVNVKEYEENIIRTLQKLINESQVLQQLFIGVPLKKEDIEKLKNDLLSNDIDTDKLCEIFDCKSNDFVAILTNILRH